MEVPRGPRVVVVDASVLINFLILRRLDLLGAVPGLEFVVPDHVMEEIRVAPQRELLKNALDAGGLRRVSLTELETVTLSVELRGRMGVGEASCLALAQSRGWIVASDEKGIFRREALARLGEGRIVTTAGLLVMAIRAGLLTIEQADILKRQLEKHRFRLPFNSFGEVV